MAGRPTNLALLALVLLGLVTGVLSFAFGTEAATAVVIGHGVVGLGIVVLAPWKTTIVGRSLGRRGWRQGVSLALSAATVAAIATGLLHTSGTLLEIGTLSMMQLHVGSGAGVAALALVHFVMKPTRPRRVDLTRRNLLRGAAVLGLAGVGYATVEALYRVSGLPGGDRRFTGSHPVESDQPNGFPATQWLDDSVQHLDPETHRIAIAGVSYSMADLENADEVRAVLDCTGGWHVERAWSGVRLDRLIGGAGGASLLVSSVTGYWRRFPLADAGHLYLATQVDGEALSDGHGGPVRLVAPGRRGYQWVKWVESVVVDDTPWWWQPPLPLT
jgi:hypothetical protein